MGTGMDSLSLYPLSPISIMLLCGQHEVLKQHVNMFSWMCLQPFHNRQPYFLRIVDCGWAVQQTGSLDIELGIYDQVSSMGFMTSSPARGIPFVNLSGSWEFHLSHSPHLLRLPMALKPSRSKEKRFSLFFNWASSSTGCSLIKQFS